MMDDMAARRAAMIQMLAQQNMPGREQWPPTQNSMSFDALPQMPMTQMAPGAMGGMTEMPPRPIRSAPSPYYKGGPHKTHEGSPSDFQNPGNVKPTRARPKTTGYEGGPGKTRRGSESDKQNPKEKKPKSAKAKMADSIDADTMPVKKKKKGKAGSSKSYDGPDKERDNDADD